MFTDLLKQFINKVPRGADREGLQDTAFNLVKWNWQRLEKEAAALVLSGGALLGNVNKVDSIWIQTKL